MELIVVNITLLGIILLSSTLHEAMHAYTSWRLGDDTALKAGRLTLNPIAHIDPFLSVILPFFLAISGLPIIGAAKPVPFNPNRVRGAEKGAALVAVSGPLTNLVLAFVFGLPLRLFVLPAVLTELLVLCVLVNLGFFIFNMLPIPPLDGSRLLYAFSPDSVRRTMTAIERSGLIFIMAFVLLFSGLFGPLFSRLVSTLFEAIVGAPLGLFAIL